MRRETNGWNIKKHEISWSKRNSPNYYNLANIRETAAAAVSRFRIRDALFVDTQYILYVSHTYLLFCLHKLFSIDISVKWLLLHVPTALFV